ncbi:DUF6934 family protein [Dyadobacter chenhuakuii]|uniref:Uncharacterized protein n=1 Tax=Dyadobacter chenhuakuii TaxID=2909339 RepID=A0ABY4XJA5_9BACT|nr:hypothetical protein [Dyadobacter chenhuakuii]MCF2496397.1 hypothetical protein [Dyadobacter chenhuakuii]USJ30455.1 hypothetical protein NFI80_21665 [Dyadobacter chenhuakuii]
MNSEYYQTEASEDRLEFLFDSVSEKKTIPKIITFTRYADGIDLFNLAFGDLKEDARLDDLAVSNNADMEKVMATVIQSIFLFFQENPKAVLYIEGSTMQRTRLYRIIISRELSAFQKDFDIFGRIKSESEPFVLNRPYDGFVVKVKN